MKSKKIKICVGLVIISIACIISCTKTATPTTYNCTTTYSYAKDIAPILNASCATVGCHNAATKADGYDLSSYTAVKSANSSKVIGSMQQISGFEAMPRGANKLHDTLIMKLSCWYNNGTPQ